MGSANVSEKQIVSLNIPLLIPCPGSLIRAAPCRMWTELPQALRIQHPKQLQRSSQTSSVHHLPQQQPVPAPLHH